MRKLLPFTLLAMAPVFAIAEDYLVHEWKKIRLAHEFWAEGIDSGEFNKDGLDVVVGNKKGAFVHLHSVKKVGKEAKPKRIKKP